MNNCLFFKSKLKIISFFSDIKVINGNILSFIASSTLNEKTKVKLFFIISIFGL